MRRRLWPSIALTLAAASPCACLQAPPAGGQTVTAEAGVDGGQEPGAILDPARPLAELYAAGEIRAFEFKQLGEPIGRSFGRYEGTVEVGGQPLHHFSTRVELLPPGGKALRFASELMLDETGDLVSGWERSVAAELRFTLDRDQATLVIEADAGLPELERAELAYDPGTAFMGYMSTIHEELMFALRPLALGENEWRLISLSAGRADPWSARALSLIHI